MPNFATNVYEASAFDRNKEAQTEGLILVENYGFPCSIDGLRVLSTDAGLSSLIWVLGVVPVVSKRLTYLKIMVRRERSRDSMPHYTPRS